VFRSFCQFAFRRRSPSALPASRTLCHRHRRSLRSGARRDPCVAAEGLAWSPHPQRRAPPRSPAGGPEEQCCHLGTFCELGRRACSKAGVLRGSSGCLPAPRRRAGREAGSGDGLFGLAFVFLQNY